jgi:deoxyribodipyrimidine photolyase-related protein
MSDYGKGGWTEIWDALFWNFIHNHKKYVATNNRTVFISRNLEKMPSFKLNNHLNTAEKFLISLN